MTMATRNIVFACVALVGCQSGTSARDTSAGFAIECVGKATFAGNPNNDSAGRNYDLPSQIYVLNKKAKTVQRALVPRQEYEEVCFTDGYIDAREFSPGLISLTSEKKGARCEFIVDRKSGKGEYFSAEDLPNGSTSKIEFKMICKPTNMPNFNTSENRF